MLPTAGHAAEGDSPTLHAFLAMTSDIRAAGDVIEDGRQLPTAIVQVTHDTGIFGMALHYVWGGPEPDPLMQCRIIEAPTIANGTVGWCAMINVTAATSPPSSTRRSYGARQYGRSGAIASRHLRSSCIESVGGRISGDASHQWCDVNFGTAISYLTS
jgi:alkylation response protein AidB-like acyl-CoA dehydrogenase